MSTRHLIQRALAPTLRVRQFLQTLLKLPSSKVFTEVQPPVVGKRKRLEDDIASDTEEEELEVWDIEQDIDEAIETTLEPGSKRQRLW